MRTYGTQHVGVSVGPLALTDGFLQLNLNISLNVVAVVCYD